MLFKKRLKDRKQNTCIINNKTELQNEVELYYEMFQAQTGGVFVVNGDDKQIIIINDAAKAMYSWNENLDFHENFLDAWDRIELDRKDALLEGLVSFIDSDDIGNTFEYECRVKNPNTGIYTYLLSRAKLIMTSTGRKLLVHSSVDITEQKLLEQRLYVLSNTDYLTGISNRGYGERSIRSLLSNGMDGLFLLFDIDDFKKINDVCGHMVGDRVIVEVADALKKTAKDSKGIIMRLGGDEFAAFVPKLTEIDMANAFLASLLKEINNCKLSELNSSAVSVSIGAVICKELTDDAKTHFEKVYSIADSVMYQAKKNGGNHFVVADAI